MRGCVFVHVCISVFILDCNYVCARACVFVSFMCFAGNWLERVARTLAEVEARVVKAAKVVQSVKDEQELDKAVEDCNIMIAECEEQGSLLDAAERSMVLSPGEMLSFEQSVDLNVS